MPFFNGRAGDSGISCLHRGPVAKLAQSNIGSGGTGAKESSQAFPKTIFWFDKYDMNLNQNQNEHNYKLSNGFSFKEFQLLFCASIATVESQRKGQYLAQ